MSAEVITRTARLQNADKGGRTFDKRTAKIAERRGGRAERDAGERIGLSRESSMQRSNREPNKAEAGQRVPARPHDPGSQSNETVDGLDTVTEALRHAAEDTACGAKPDDIEKTPVFDRAGLAPKI
jgi:hypothetical protein